MGKRQWLWVVISVLLIAGCSGEDKKVTSSPGAGPAGRLYLLNQGDGTMYVFDTETLTRLDSVDTRVDMPHYIEFAPDGQNFYVTTLESSGHIAKFNATTNAFVSQAAMPPAIKPSAIAITSDSRFGYICNFSSPDIRTVINKFDLSTLQQVRTLQAGAITHDLKITSDGSVVVAVNQNTDDMTLVYPDGDTVTFVNIDPDEPSIPYQPRYGPLGVVIDDNDSLAFIACVKANQVRMLDIAARKIVDSIDIPITPGGAVSGPTLLAVSPDNDIVYVTTQGGNALVAFRVSTKAIIADIPFATASPFGITMTDDGSRVYVACVGSTLGHGRVYIIDGASPRKLDSIDVGNQSYGLIWQPAP